MSHVREEYMRRIGYIAITICALVTMAAPAPAAAQGSVGASLDDLRGILPYMMLVVDTSGSMERLPACTCTTPGCEECMPDCSLPNDGNGKPPVGGDGEELKKNRWAVTLEALTGTFNNFECEALQRTVTNGMSYDLGYYLPYHQPWDCSVSPAGEACDWTDTESTLDQNDDGILDAYKTRVQFGLMAFDGWDTYVGAPPLVAATDFDTSLSEDVQGLWSYGGAKSFHYPNCVTDYMMDTGARSPDAEQGALVSLDSCSDPLTNCPDWCGDDGNSADGCPSDQLSINDDIQEALMGARPYGGTPIAASLDDLYHHLKNDLSDIYGSCRNRYGLLITDGYPDDDYRQFGCNCAEDQDPMDPNYCGGPTNDPTAMHCPYPTPEEAARDLVQGRDGDPAMLEQLFVVGLAIDDQLVLDRLNAIADNGCPTAACDTNGGNEALFADDLDQLISSLSDIIEAAIDPISRSVPTFATAGENATARQYQISTGFEVPLAEGDPWTGVIERRRFLCNAGALSEADLSAADKFHETLNTLPSRDLWTANWDVANFSGEDHLYRGDESGAACPLGTQRDQHCANFALDPDNTTPILTLANMDLAAGEEDERTDILNWMHGLPGTARAGKAMGDVFHSSPVVIDAPRFDIADEAFNAFRQQDQVRGRPQVLYVGSNDGILHAFSLEDYDNGVDEDFTEGEEMWGFVPPLLINDIKNNPNTHQFMMDGTPVVKDVYLNRDKSADANPDQYKTVLITGMRGGGKAYIALDVTDPINPEFMWQFTDEAMGWTYAQPAIGQATFTIEEGASTVTKNGAVAILPGGKGQLGVSGELNDCVDGLQTQSMRTSPGNAVFKTFEQIPGSGTNGELDHRADVRCWQTEGRALYFVDVETGKLIKKIHKNSSGELIFPSPLVSTPALFQNEVGTLASRAFIVDMDGVIWRVDLSSDDAVDDDPLDGWTARPFHDIFWDTTPSSGELTYEPPIISVDDQARLVLLVGTGDNDDFSDATADNRVVSVTEVLDPAASATPGPEDYRAAMNWEMRVKPTDGFVTSEMVTGTMALFNSTLFFGTFIVVGAGADACDLGRGRLHAVHYINRDPDDSNPGTNPTTYGPQLIDIGADSDANSVINVAASSAQENFMVMGLNITQRPTCTQIDTDNFDVWSQDLPGVQELAEPAVYLVAQATGGNNAAGDLIQKRAQSEFGTIQVKLKRKTDAKSTTSRIVGWATSID